LQIVLQISIGILWSHYLEQLPFEVQFGTNLILTDSGINNNISLLWMFIDPLLDIVSLKKALFGLIEILSHDLQFDIDALQSPRYKIPLVYCAGIALSSRMITRDFTLGHR